MISSTFTYGSNALQSAYHGMTRSAEDIANASVAQPVASNAPANAVHPIPAGEDMNTALVGMKQQQHLFNASAKIFSTADQQIGTLLDTTA